MSDLENYVGRVAKGLDTTAPSFAEFMRDGVATHAIPFFGDVESAIALTVGVNPSAEEFIGRSWPQFMSAPELTKRLQSYFTTAPVQPHRWFETWTKALSQLDLSYSKNVAHLDLSARATASMGSHHDWKGFLGMVDSDAKWFFELLPMCQKARALLVAGCVTKRWYINAYIERIAPKYGYRLSGNAESVGEGRVGFHRLIGPRCDLQMFFCSVSPSGNRQQILIDRVNAHKAQIKTWLDSKN